MWTSLLAVIELLCPLSQRSNVETLSPKGMASRDEAFEGQLGWIRSWRWRVYGRNTCLKGHGVSLLSSLCVSLSFPHCSKEGHVSAYRRKTHEKPTVLPPWIFSNAGPHPHKAVLHRWATSQPLVFETWSHCTSKAGLKLVTIDFHSLVVNMDPQDYVLLNLFVTESLFPAVSDRFSLSHTTVIWVIC